MVRLPDGEKTLRICRAYNRLDSIPVCDGQTDGQTSCHGIVRAMHTRHAVKIRSHRSPSTVIVIR